MSIKLNPKERSGSTTSVEKKNLSEYAFFIAINILVLPFSAYQTFVGYQADVAGSWLAALAIAAISAVFFAAMNFGIRDRRQQGKRYGWQVLIYIIPIGISFPGNFNAFYSNQMKDQLYESGISEYNIVFNKTINESKTSLKSCTGVAGLEASYSTLMGELKTQYDGNVAAGIPSGWGSDCRAHWNKIKLLLKEADPSGQGIMNNLRNESYSGAQSLANPVFQNLVSRKNNDIRIYLNDIAKTKKSIDSTISLAKNNNTIEEEGVFILDEIKLNNNRIGNEVNTYLLSNGCDSLKYEELKPSAQNQLSTIKFALQNGFGDMPSPGATFFSLFLSLIIDLAALLYILFFVTTGKKKDDGGRINTPIKIN